MVYILIESDRSALHRVMARYETINILASLFQIADLNIDLLTNVLVVSTMLPSASHKCGCTNRSRPWIQAGPRIQAGGL